MFVVERAHRMPARPPPQGAPPRTFIAKLLNYKDRDTALRMAREKGNIPVGNVKVAIFPDFSAEVQRRRQSFTEAKRKLRNLQYKYSMLFPAVLGWNMRVVRSSSRIQRRWSLGWNEEPILNKLID